MFELIIRSRSRKPSQAEAERGREREREIESGGESAGCPGEEGGERKRDRGRDDVALLSY